ncbi:MAG: hypothetical protein GX452_05520 [Ignavibacteriales bacterium]|jgi:hypothetical protein|nr:hypothetical protein [Ignavibacteriaceae bacterium]NLH60845.1 hypothetical protein [Ignavibacteriales bacterium]
MTYSNKLPHIIIGAFILFFLLRLTGLISLSVFDLLIYIQIIGGFGFSLFFIGKGKPLFLFFSAFFFLTGITFFLFESFIFTSESKAFLPAVLFILGSGFLILFADNSQKRWYLLISFLLICTSLIILIIYRAVSLPAILFSFWMLLSEQWVIFILIPAAILFITIWKRST